MCAQGWNHCCEERGGEGTGGDRGDMMRMPPIMSPPLPLPPTTTKAETETEGDPLSPGRGWLDGCA